MVVTLRFVLTAKMICLAERSEDIGKVFLIPLVIAGKRTKDCWKAAGRGGSRVLQLLHMQQSEFAEKIVIKLKF